MELVLGIVVLSFRGTMCRFKFVTQAHTRAVIWPSQVRFVLVPWVQVVWGGAYWAGTLSSEAKALLACFLNRR